MASSWFLRRQRVCQAQPLLPFSTMRGLALNPEGIARDIITVGGSAGALAPLMELVGSLGHDFPGVVAIVLHRSPVTPSMLRHILARQTILAVIEPDDGAVLSLLPGRIYVAPPDEHLVFHDAGIRTN